MPHIILSLYNKSSQFYWFSLPQLIVETVTMETMAVHSHSVCTFAQAVGSPTLAVVVVVVVHAAVVVGSVVEVKKMDTAVDRSRWKGLRSNHSWRLFLLLPLLLLYIAASLSFSLAGFSLTLPFSPTLHQLQQSQLELRQCEDCPFFLSCPGFSFDWFLVCFPSAFIVCFPSVLFVCLSEHFWRGGDTKVGE